MFIIIMYVDKEVAHTIGIYVIAYSYIIIIMFKDS